MAVFSGVHCLNAVVWEVEDPCHMLLLDWPIAGAVGCRLHAATITERLEGLFFLFHICSVKG